MTTADIVANLAKLAAADEHLGEVAATIEASKDAGEVAKQIAIAEAHIGDALSAMDDARNVVGHLSQDLLEELTWAKRDLAQALRTLGRARDALAALQALAPPQETRQ